MAEVAAEVKDLDTFDAAFEQLSKMGDESGNTNAIAPAAEAPAAEAPVEPAKPAEGEQPAEPASGDPAGDGVAAGGAEAPAAEAEGAAAEPAEEPVKEPAKAATSDDALKRFTEFLERQEQSRQEQPQPTQEEQRPELFNAQELETLQTFEKDWPEVANAIRPLMRAHGQMVAQHIFSEVNKFLAPRLEMLDAVAHRVHAKDLETIPNYQTTKDKVIAWATSDDQPEYLRKAYKEVIDSGSVDEVKDLIYRYELANGVQRQQAQQAPKPAQKKATELPPAAKQAAASLAPVSGKRSNAVSVEEPQTFDDAFAKYAAEP